MSSSSSFAGPPVRARDLLGRSACSFFGSPWLRVPRRRGAPSSSSPSSIRASLVVGLVGALVARTLIFGQPPSSEAYVWGRGRLYCLAAGCADVRVSVSRRRCARELLTSHRSPAHDSARRHVVRWRFGLSAWRRTSRAWLQSVTDMHRARRRCRAGAFLLRLSLSPRTAVVAHACRLCLVVYPGGALLVGGLRRGCELRAYH